MYVQGVSTRKVKAVTEELGGHDFSASTVSRLNVKLDETLRRFAERPLDEDYSCVILDARYERVREDGIVGKHAVLIAIGVNFDGRRCLLGVNLANRESQTSWKDFISSVLARGLRAVEYVVSDDHASLKKALTQTLPGTAWQHCDVHFLRNALDHLPRKHDDDCMTELRWIYDRRKLTEARGFATGSHDAAAKAAGRRSTQHR